MLVVFVNPPEIPGHLSDRDKAGGLGTLFPMRRRHGAVVPPLDLLYSAAVCEGLGADVRIVDAPACDMDLEAVARQIAFADPDWVGLRLSLPSLKQDLALARRLCREGRRVALFGNVIQTTHDRWLDQSAAAVMFGEPEALWPALIAGQDHPFVRRPGDPAPRDWHLISELDALPFPAWRHLQLASYAQSGLVEDVVFYLLTSRGCPRACAMCPYYVHQGTAWRSRDPKSVVAEIRYLVALGARRIQVRDPNFGLDRQRLKAISRALVAEALPVRIAVETDLEALDDEALVLLRAAGVRTIMTGLESSDPDCLADIKQSETAFKKNLRQIKRTSTLGIEVVGFLVVGATSESHQSVRTTVAIARDLPIRYSVSLMTPYPGTAFTAEALAAGRTLSSDDYQRMGGTKALLSTRFMTRAEVDRAHRWADRELSVVEARRRLKKAHGIERFRALASCARRMALLLPARVFFERDAWLARRRGAPSPLAST